MKIRKNVYANLDSKAGGGWKLENTANYNQNLPHYKQTKYTFSISSG